MNGMTLERAAKLCGGKIYGEYDKKACLGRIVIDSRAIMPGDVFIAYKGEKADGHDYIPMAFEKGAVCCIAQHPVEGETRPLIVTEDVQAAVETIASAYRESLSIPVIGITGSVGKTSAKEMIGAVLSARLNILKTDKNFNNRIGVPMTVSRIEPEHEAAVIEMGISQFGEMTYLARIARPTVAVFTVIGHAHLEFLGDLDGVLRAKTEMLAMMDDDAVMICNGDDERLRAFPCRQRKLCFGLSPACDVRAVNVDMSSPECVKCDIEYGSRCVHAYIPAYGQHMIYAALAGAAVGFELGLTDREIEQGIASYETVGRRGAVTKTERLTLVDDCYNANPDSVKCGIDSLMKLPGRHVCILSDMLELGEDEAEMHRGVGEYALEKGINLVLTCGERSVHTAAGAGAIARHYPDTDALIKALPEVLEIGDSVLVKASNAMHLERVSETLKGL